MAPNSETLLEAIPSQFSENEKAEVTDVLKRTLPKKRALLEERGFLEALKELEKAGEIDPNYGDTKLLEMLAEKTTKKQEVLKLIKDFRPSVPIIKKFVGRDVDMERILKFLSDIRVSGVNLFGESGVGKTFLAKEVCVKLRDRFEPFLIDLKGTKALKNVYFKILNAFELAPWDYSKERIYNHLQNFKKRTLLYLDNVEQFLSKESEDDQANRKEFLEFLKAIITSKACKTGQLKVFLTSRAQIDEKALKHALFVEYKLESFSKKVSGDLISRRVKDNELDEEQHQAKVKIIGLCRNTAYLLQGAEQLKREYYSSSVQVLEKISAQIEKGVPERFACSGAMFDALPSDHLKEVAVKISLLCCSFSVSTAMKIAEIPLNYDARWDLEMLVNQKIITAEDKDGKRKYDVHALFREFITSHLCNEDPFYGEQLQRGEKLFFAHFSGKLTKLAQSMEANFVQTYSKLELNRANFELTFDLSQENQETFDLLLYPGKLEKFALMGIMFEVLKERHERKELYANWAKAAENQEQWLASALMRCWQSMQHTSGIGETKQAQSTLEKANESIKKAEQTASTEQLNEVKSLYLHSSGKINYLRVEGLTHESKRKAEGRKLLVNGIKDLKDSISLQEKLMEDSTLTSRALNLIGNCYLELEEPEEARDYYLKAMEMKRRLVGHEEHWEFSTFYNQIAQVHERIGRQQEEKWYNRIFGSKKKSRIEFKEAVKWMKKALDLQEKLELSGTAHTALFQRNLANIFLSLEEYDNALEYAKKSYETRYNILKEHPDTVRTLYLIGMIHEWRKDHKAALQSYEEAFEMEESLPEDNHSIVRENIRQRLTKMCKKLKDSDKLEKFNIRVKEIDEKANLQSPQAGPSTLQQPIEPPSDNNEPIEIEINVYRNGGYYNHSTYGHFLYFPPNTVTEPTEVKCKVLDAHPILSPVRFAETLSGHILELGPSSVHLRNPIIITLLHSGPEPQYGYETIVRSFNAVDKKWQEKEVLKEDSHAPKYCRSHYLQVCLRELSTLAVITRLITERCQVTSKGCVVMSSVCEGVTVEFPEGAIADKDINGEIQVLPTKGSVINEHIVPCPAVIFHGFEDVTFLKTVKIKVPFPSSVVPSTPRLLRWGFHDGQSDQWKIITGFKVENGFIEFVVDHFSVFWPLSTLNASAKYVIDSVSSCCGYWFNPPIDVSFAAYMRSGQAGDEVDLQLTCVALDRQEALTERMEKNFKYLVDSTGNKPMKYRDKAFPDVQDCTPLDKDFFLEFLGEGKDCNKQFVVNTTSDRISLQYYNNVTERNDESRLCNLLRLTLKPKPDINNVDSSGVIEYFGVLIDELCETPEDVVTRLPKYCKNLVFKDWYDTGAKMFYSNLPRDNPDCFQDLLNSLGEFDGARHLANYLTKGHRLVTKPLKTSRHDIKENVIDIVARNVDCYYGPKLGNYLGVSKDFVDECRKKYSGDEQVEQVSQTIKKWMNSSDNGTVEDLFKALRYLKMTKAALELATFTTKISKQED